ncbi:hypothetical protein GCM10027566_41150 [Arachidicoccus ginsenosidivorans]|jgi:uncharacterized protein YkwD|uniref:CAP domain-containing protein n=1 Tax=Arachidicoccus ginsenosidivorans TaxID=496057 RepID=A0A5B8VRB8_9BACT|nr:CAP domain-containing protein [Arachidicoccus ginsenosidivorans]QEC73145.1 CAP domain-containing protein [Arachidicoccus ginsenosidivorans]
MRQFRSLLFISLCSFGLIVCVSAQSRGQFQREILKYTNQYRHRQGLPALVLDGTASRLAQQHSSDMAAGRAGFGHGGFQSRTNKLRAKYGRYIATGENVAFGKLSARQVVNIWIHSAPHRKNLRGKFNKVGIGIAYNRQGVAYFTQLFVRTRE